MVTLDRTFYLQPATAVAGAFLGKVLVHETQWGRLSGVICDVEAYPAFVDGVHHGNKRTKRSGVMAAQWPAGRAPATLSNSPGKLCKSMLITTDQHGADLCGDVLFVVRGSLRHPPSGGIGSCRHPAGALPSPS